jgi:actin related protein 2/3 complex subunit 2
MISKNLESDRELNCVSQADKVTVAFPMRFKDSVDTILATSFLKEFVEARRAAALNTAPSCSWSPTAPQELEGAPKETLSANAGFVTFGMIFLKYILFELNLHW